MQTWIIKKNTSTTGWGIYNADGEAGINGVNYVDDVAALGSLDLLSAKRGLTVVGQHPRADGGWTITLT